MLATVALAPQTPVSKHDVFPVVFTLSDCVFVFHVYCLNKFFFFCFQGDQVGIAARMFKALIGRGHPEFSTNRQQDAQEFLLHFINMVEVKSSLFHPILHPFFPSSVIRFFPPVVPHFLSFVLLTSTSEKLSFGGEPV